MACHGDAYPAPLVTSQISTRRKKRRHALGLDPRGHGEPQESERCRGRRLHDVAANHLGHTPSIEIHDKADPKSAHAQVGEQLRFMNRQDGRNRLDLKDDLTRDNDVSPEPFPYTRVLVDDRNSNLPLEWNTGLAQLMTKALLVHGFK